MNLMEIEEECYGMFGYDGTPSPDIVNRFRRNINSVYFELMGKKGTSRLRRLTTTFVSTANLDLVVMPQPTKRILTIQDRINQWTLTERSLQELRFDDPAELLISSFPYEYVMMNRSAPLTRDPTVPSELFIQSTSANDTSGVVAYIEGLVTGGYLRTASIALNGLTAVSFNAAITNWTNVTKLYLSSIARGEVVITQTSGAGMELGRIPPGRRFSRFTRLLLHPVPAVAQTYYIDLELSLTKLENPTEEPLIPEDYHWLLASMASLREWMKRGNLSAYGAEAGRAKMGVADMIVDIARDSGVPLGERGRRFSQLGSYFPAGT